MKEISELESKLKLKFDEIEKLKKVFDKKLMTNKQVNEITAFIKFKDTFEFLVMK